MVRQGRRERRLIGQTARGVQFKWENNRQALARHLIYFHSAKRFDGGSARYVHYHRRAHNGHRQADRDRGRRFGRR